MLKYADLYDYQIRMAQWLYEGPFRALWAEPGLGKTIGTLTCINTLKNENAVKHPLIVAPLRVSKTVWPKEIHKWEHTAHMTCSRLYWPDSQHHKNCYGELKKLIPVVDENETEKQRIKRLKIIDKTIYKHYVPWLKSKLKENATFYVINREQLHLLTRILYQNWCFDMVVLDESTSFKHSNTARFKGLKAVRNKIYRLVELTGTPASNGLLNIWAQMYLLDQGEALSRSYSRFKDLYFIKGHDGFTWELRPGAKEQIYKRIEHMCMTLLEEDYLNLPELITNLVPIEVPPFVQRQYKELEKNFILQVGNEAVHAVSKGVLYNKMRQFCNGAIYTDGTIEDPDTPHERIVRREGKKNWKLVHNLKIEAIKDIVDEAEGTPVMVAYQFKHDFQRLKAVFPNARTIENEQDEEDWNAGRIPELLMHPASAGHGLNLQYGGHILIWMGLTTDLELFLQTWKRLRRQGQTKPVIMHIIFLDIPFERGMMPVIDQKRVTMYDLMNYMKKDGYDC